MLSGDCREVDEYTYIKNQHNCYEEKKSLMHLFEYGDRDRGDLHLPSLKSLILSTPRRPGEGIPGKEAGGAVYGRRIGRSENMDSAFMTRIAQRTHNTHLSAINLEFTPLDAVWSETSLKLSGYKSKY